MSLFKKPAETVAHPTTSVVIWVADIKVRRVLSVSLVTFPLLYGYHGERERVCLYCSPTLRVGCSKQELV